MLTEGEREGTRVVPGRHDGVAALASEHLTPHGLTGDRPCDHGRCDRDVEQRGAGAVLVGHLQTHVCRVAAGGLGELVCDHPERDGHRAVAGLGQHV